MIEFESPHMPLWAFFMMASEIVARSSGDAVDGLDDEVEDVEDETDAEVTQPQWNTDDSDDEDDMDAYGFGEVGIDPKGDAAWGDPEDDVPDEEWGNDDPSWYSNMIY